MDNSEKTYGEMAYEAYVLKMTEQGSGNVYALWSYLSIDEQTAWEEVGTVIRNSYALERIEELSKTVFNPSRK